MDFSLTSMLHIRRVSPQTVQKMSRVLIEKINTVAAQDHRFPASKRRPLLTAVIASCLVLTACAHAQSEKVSPAPREPTMTTDHTTTQDGDAPLHPKLTAEQALLRMLELIRTSKTIADFTPERLEQVMGVPISPRGDGYGFYEPLTLQWSHVFFVEEVKAGLSITKPHRQFQFLFTPNSPGTSPSMTDICQVDFDKFAIELEVMGFSRGSYYDSPPQPPSEEFRLPHGRLMYDYFDRPDMRIEVYPRGESNERAAHNCVEWVFVY